MIPVKSVATTIISFPATADMFVFNVSALYPASDEWNVFVGVIPVPTLYFNVHPCNPPTTLVTFVYALVVPAPTVMVNGASALAGRKYFGACVECSSCSGT
jgi:hypothetical protein